MTQFKHFLETRLRNEIDNLLMEKGKEHLPDIATVLELEIEEENVTDRELLRIIQNAIDKQKKQRSILHVQFPVI